MQIPWAKPYITSKDVSSVANSVEEAWLSSGPANEIFEDLLKEYFKIDYALSTSSGTTAIQLALMALNLSPGSTIAVPEYSYMAFANVAHLMKYNIIFYEVEYETLQPTLNTITNLPTQSIDLIVIVSNYGNYSDIDSISQWCKENSIYLIEDCAEALGTEFQGRKVGTFGDIGILSFHATKTITTGEGGAVLTSNLDFYNKMKLIRSHGVGQIRYLHLVPGLNFRLTNMQASLGISQFDSLEKIKSSRKELYSQYYCFFTSLNIGSAQRISHGVDQIPWAFSFLFDDDFPKFKRVNLFEALKHAEIEIRRGFFAPDKIHYFKCIEEYPNANRIHNNIFLPPFYVGMTEFEFKYITNTIENHI